MRYSFVKAMLILPLLLAGAHSATGASIDPAEVYNYWNAGCFRWGIVSGCRHL